MGSGVLFDLFSLLSGSFFFFYFIKPYPKESCSCIIEPPAHTVDWSVGQWLRLQRDVQGICGLVSLHAMCHINFD